MLIDAKSIDGEQNNRLLRSGHARLHFSQLGEDAVILHLLAGKRNGFFVEVGCHHPLRFSNTALLSEYFGWSGLDIDADADLISAFNEGRTRDINVCACIGKDRGVKHLNVFHETAVNTIDQAHADNMAAACFKLRERRPVEVFPPSEIVEAHVSADVDVDLLSVDAEGMDLEVLQSFDWKRRPQVVAVEAHGFTLSEAVAHPTHAFMQSKGYRLNSHLVVTSIYERV